MSIAVHTPPESPALGPIVTIPNALTVIRLLGALALLFTAWNWEPASLAAAVGVLAATDWFDGWIARSFNSTSEFGRLLDPVADRVLMISSLILLVSLDGVPLRLGLAIVLLREAVLSILVPVLVLNGMATPHVSWWGKAATFIALSLIVIESALMPLTGIVSSLVSITWLGVAAMSVWSASTYLRYTKSVETTSKKD